MPCGIQSGGNGDKDSSVTLFFFIFLFFVFLLGISRTASAAYGVSQAKGLIGPVAPGLLQSHCNVGSKSHLQPTP